MEIDQQRITWISPEYFLDTDIHVIYHLSTIFEIKWYIICSNASQTDYKEEIETLSKKGVEVEIFPIYPRGMDPRNILRFVNLAKTIRRSKCRFVYESLSYPFYFLPIMAHYIGTKRIVLGIHNVRVPKGGTHYFRNSLYTDYAVKRYKHFQVFSKSQYDSLKKNHSSKDVRYIPFFLKDYGKPSRQKKTADCITFLNFGNIREYKRIDVLILAAQEAYKKTKVQFKVILAGACDNWDKYEKLIENKELFDLRIKHIPNAEIPDIFVDADYAVLPYQDIAQSGSAIIALNYEIPIIASRLPAFEEYIIDHKTGFLIAPADIQELRDKIVYILINHKLIYPQMKKYIQESNKAIFAEDRIVDLYKELIHDIIQQ